MSKISSGIVLRKCGLESKAVRCMYLYITNAVSDSWQTLLILGMKQSSMHLIWQVKEGNNSQIREPWPSVSSLPFPSCVIFHNSFRNIDMQLLWLRVVRNFSSASQGALKKGFCPTMKLRVMFKHVFPGISLPVIKFEYLLGVKYLIMKLGDCTSNAAT